MELSDSDDPKKVSFPSAEEALKHLLWLSDGEAVYEAALGLYDLNLAAIVALNSQWDPNEFLPFLQELECMPTLLMQYSIDLKLQNTRMHSSIRQWRFTSPPLISTVFPKINPKKKKILRIGCILKPYEEESQGHMSTLFSIKVHHGGEFSTGPNKEYVGGRIDDVDGLDSDLMSLHELDSIAHYLGYGPPIAFHIRVPGLSLDTGLVTMKSDADVNAMITLLSSSRTVELYVEHIGGVQFVETQLQPVQEDGLEFLNIDDGDVTQVESIQKVGDGDIDEPNSDQSTEEDQYSDGSYAMTDDDALYETFVDDDVEFRGFGQSSQLTLENVAEDTLEGEEIVLSDAVCDTEDESPYSSSDDDNPKPKHHQFKKFRAEHDMEDPKFVLG
ncbi:hypothetical protein RHMOL_Rhmol03G0147900 [Rhododendron molle]|uniref:Uncharacterized protein n=1 Tax=Rhododendron molle TaxID=49168 RepID=A0ACC0PFY8_RHOML|nr:hypothetical protein RHMOL_Rhmol03G0147900 [Rhododendron molle]